MSTHTPPQLSRQHLTRMLLLLSFVAMSLFCSCQQQERYHISGYTNAQEGADPPMVKLLLDGKTIDSGFVHKGEFLLKGNYVDSMSKHIAYLEITGEEPIPVILTTQPLSIDFIKRKLLDGDYLNNELNRLYDSLDSLGYEFKRKLADIPTDSALFDAFDQDFKTSIDDYIILAKEYCLRHPNDPVGIISTVMLLTINGTFRAEVYGACRAKQSRDSSLSTHLRQLLSYGSWHSYGRPDSRDPTRGYDTPLGSPNPRVLHPRALLVWLVQALSR